MNIRIEKWLGHEIRFVQVEKEWYAVAKDVAGALELKDATEVSNMVDDDEKMILTNLLLSGSSKLHDVLGQDFYRQGKAILINEFGVYEAIFNSRSKEAKEFKKWVKQLLKQLREGIGASNIFSLMDKTYQSEIMDKISMLKGVSKQDYIKANTIANKAVSTRFGYPKMISKDKMSPQMLIDRMAILEDVAELMLMKDSYGLDISVSKTIYQKYS